MARSYFEHGIRDRADAQERLALNGMLRGAGDPDLWRLVRQQQTSQTQALAGQLGSFRQEYGTDAVRTELAQMQQRMQALHQQQHQWQQQQRRD